MMMTGTFWRKLMLPAVLLGIAVITVLAGREWHINSPEYGLPYEAEFSSAVEDDWTAWGGTWEVEDGAMRNDSNDRGAKILTGSPNWTDYTVEGDVQLLGSGSIGMLGRVREPEIGENALKGYLAGVRTADHSLFLGTYDFFYREAARVEMPEPVRPYRWYHIKLEFKGCRITASAWAVGTDDVRTRSIEETDCFSSGRVGLRSNGTGGVWRNVKASPIDSSPTVEGGEGLLPEWNVASFEGSLLSRAEPLPERIQSVRSLQYMSPFGSPIASIRGAVTLTRPTVYVQDSTGGIEIRFDGANSLKVGDEVEVTGEVNLDDFSPFIEKARFRRIRQSPPEAPVDVAAQHLADGTFDGNFVEVEGTLRSILRTPDGAVTMGFDAGAQSFSAIMPAGRSGSHVKDIELGSQLRLRGISTVDGRFNKAADPFVILVRSAEGVDVVAGPPIRRPTIFALIGLAGIILIFGCNHLYLLIKHWRLHAVAEERERLAHQIHDTLAQSFAGIGFQLQAIRNSIPKGDESLDHHVELAMLMAQTSHEEARRCIASLRPEPIDQISLIPALRRYAELIAKDGDVKVETSGEDRGRTIPSRVREAFFRIGKEAIANSIRHAGARTIRIELEHQRDILRLSISDDGMGFSAEGDGEGFGMLGMRRRAESISATLSVRSTLGSGTRVEVNAAVGPRLRIRKWLNVEAWR